MTSRSSIGPSASDARDPTELAASTPYSLPTGPARKSLDDQPIGPGAQVKMERNSQSHRERWRSVGQATTRLIENSMPCVDVILERPYIVEMTAEASPLSDMPDDIPIFTMALVASAVGLSANTLRAWFQRGHIRLAAEDSKVEGRTGPNRFTLRSVLVLGITAELVRLGETPSEAFAIAQEWAAFGNVKGEEGAPARREPGGLFPDPYHTFLLVGPDLFTQHNRERWRRIVAIDPTDTNAYAKMFGALFSPTRPGIRVVSLNLLILRVRHACEQALHGKRLEDVDRHPSPRADTNDEGIRS